MTSLFDIQVNGFAGVDFQQPGLSASDLGRAVAALARHQTLRFFAALVTDTIDGLGAKLAHLERLRAADPAAAAALAGYHLEGPWLSPVPGYRGAHDPTPMGPPDLGAFDDLQLAAGGRIRLVTLAPEWPGSPAAIRGLRDRGVEVSLGHCQPSAADLDDAIAAGARFCTHLGNGVPALLPRHDNVIQRLLARDELTAFLIPDGIHLPPYSLQNYFRAKPPGRALFTTDAMAAAGAPAGRHRLGALELEVGPDRVVRLPGTAQFAGSALAPDEALANVQRWLGLPPADARHLLSTAPAAHFGIDLPELPPAPP